MSTRNLLFCLAGLALGFSIGFVLANRIVPAAAPTAESSAESSADSPAAAESAGNAAGPIDPAQTGGSLPPGHPDIGGTASDGSPADPDGVAATSADAQAAMEAADRRPSDFDLQVKAAETFYGLKAHEKAALYLERALKLKPRDARALTLMGNAKYDAGDYTAAATFYERALAVDPDDAGVRNDLGNTYLQRQPPDYARAIVEYRKALRSNPRHEIAMQNMAVAAVRLKDRAAAREAVDQLAATNPGNPNLASLRSALEALP